MAIIHFLLQAKGGVGKSMVASLLFQGLKAVGKEVTAYDTDPENPTFSSYKEFAVTAVKLKDGDNIDKAAFDGLFEEIFDLPPATHVVIDSGSTSFAALSSYMKLNNIMPFLQEHGHSPFLHTIVTGGQARPDTLRNLQELALNFPEAPLVVWLNPYFGRIVSSDGKTFEEFKIYREVEHQINTLVKLPEADELLSRNLAALYADHLSFEAGINASTTGLMARNRITRFWHNLVELFRQAGFAA